MNPSPHSRLRREVLRKFRQVGFWATAARIASRLFESLWHFAFLRQSKVDGFDEKYGTDTAGIIRVGSLDIPDDQMVHAVHYGPIWEDEFLGTMNALPLNYEGLSFVDFGSGKGRALLLASLFPFTKIVGVELSEQLHQTALRNITIFRDEKQKCHDLRSIQANARDFEIPNEPTLFFLDNPFDEIIIRQVVSNLRGSLTKYLRPVYIWYVNPRHRGEFDRAGFLTVVTETRRYVLYKSGGQRTAPGPATS